MKYLVLILMLLCSSIGAAEFKDISTPNGEPIYQFKHEGKEYFVWVWLVDPEGDVDSACLAKPFLTASSGYRPFNLKCASAGKAQVDAAGGVREFMINVFLPKVNEYLLELGGGTGEPPLEAEDWEKFAWIISHDIYYDDGQLYIR